MQNPQATSRKGGLVQQCIKAIAVRVQTRTVLRLIKYIASRKASAFKSATALILTVGVPRSCGNPVGENPIKVIDYSP